jgi:hypothetical protein
MYGRSSTHSVFSRYRDLRSSLYAPAPIVMYILLLLQLLLDPKSLPLVLNERSLNDQRPGYL